MSASSASGAAATAAPTASVPASASSVSGATAAAGQPLRVLHVAAEVFPLVKTGGLADVAAALPPALVEAGADARILLPGLPAIADALLEREQGLVIGAAFGAARVTLLHGILPGSGLGAYVIDAPYLYRRGGGPYQDARGADWPDNLQRYALLGWIAAHLAAGELDPVWQPDVVHAHDWHAALAPAYMAAHPATRAASVFTVHNLAFQGLFPLADFGQLGLGSSFARPLGIEFHGRLSFMKAGLNFADRVTTVSPTYAREIAGTESGAGLDGVIRSRGSDVSGILNGVDAGVWNPTTDALLPARYSAGDLSGKAVCKAALQAEAGLAADPQAPLFCIVSRLTQQKGIDLVAAALPALVAGGGQLAVLGTGDPALEAALREAQASYPGRVGVRIGYDEDYAHRLIGGADVILVPSRFEPCGLTQMYGLAYGTLPLVRRVGGLADTVADADEGALHAGRGTGFVFDAAAPEALAAVLGRALALWRRPEDWRAVMLRAMAQDWSWGGPAAQYLALYREAMEARQSAPRRVPPAA